MGDRLLGIYMNDQLAAAIVWREVAFRSQRSNDGTRLGDSLAVVAKAISEDVATFERMLETLEIRRNPVKPRIAVAAERLGRLKLNGRTREYSPLSRFAELDLLAIGIRGKVQLWENLRDLAGLGERLGDFDFDELILRAQRQFEEVERWRGPAGRAAFLAADDAAGPPAPLSAEDELDAPEDGRRPPPEDPTDDPAANPPPGIAVYRGG